MSSARSIRTGVHAAAPIIVLSHLNAVHDDLLELERSYASYLEQESLKGDVECLRTWIESYHKGDAEAAEYLSEHGPAMLENIKSKLQEATREIQRVDEESPNGANFSGGKADRLNKAAETVLHAEAELAKALNDEVVPTQSPNLAK